MHLQGGDKVQPMVVGGQIMLVDARGEDNGRDILQDKPPGRREARSHGSKKPGYGEQYLALRQKNGYFDSYGTATP